MTSRIVNFLNDKEKWFFYFFVIVNVSLLFNSHFYPTIDGPAHLHNSFVLKQMLSGTDFYNNYYSINALYIPNWIGHLFLSFAMFIVPAFLAEKLFFIFYIVLTAVSFRYFIKKAQPTNAFGASLIFPFLYTFLLQMGFYNFSLSIGIMFLALGYYINQYKNLHVKQSAILFILITLIYFSNVLTFAYTLFFIGLIGAVKFYKEYKGLNKLYFTEFGKHVAKLICISALPLLFLVLFYVSVNFTPYEKTYSMHELTDWIFDLRSLIIFDYNRDKFYTKFIFLILIMTFAITAYNFIKQKKNLIELPLAIFLVFSINLFLLFIIPDGASAGMMSDRLALLFYIFLLMLLVSMPIPKMVLMPVVLLVVFIQFRMYFKNHKETANSLSMNAEKLVNSSAFIKDKSVILPVNMSDNWIESHFSGYMGLNKDLIILENYEANVGWFPIKWNLKEMPKLTLTTKNNLGNLYWKTNENAPIEKKIDYVALYGNTSKLEQPEFAELKADLLKYYIMSYSDESSYIKLFKRIE